METARPAPTAMGAHHTLSARWGKENISFQSLVKALFFASGFAALILQVVWQRKLGTIFGVNIESTAVIVSVFMAGLGLGALLGGWLAKRIAYTHLLLFGLAEALVGVYAFISLPLIVKISHVFAGSSLFITTAVSFFLFIIPTLLMGISLPILTIYLNRRYHNVGFSTGTFYFINTLGAAIGVILSGFIFIELFGLDGAVCMSGSINLTVSCISVFFYLKNRQLSRVNAPTPREDARATFAARWINARIIAAVVLSFFLGFIALSYELIFFRLGTFIFHGLVYAFPAVLAAYLAGIAVGSTAIKRWAARLDKKSLIVTVFLELALNSYLLVAIPGLAIFADIFSVPNVLSLRNIIVMAMFDVFVVFIPTLAMGATFPLLCHYAVEMESEAGPYISFVYFANVVGATIGTLLTGFYFLGSFGLPNTMGILFILGLAILVIPILLTHDVSPAWKKIIWLIPLALMEFVVVYPWLGDVYTHLFRYRQPLEKTAAILNIAESRYGVTVIAKEVETGYPTMYGNGIYDARATIHIPSGNERALLPVFLHPNPKTVFQIGLGSGAWAKILAANPDVEKLTVVEINDASIALVATLPEVASLLTNPKLELIFDDGRRWLHAHPDRKFDFFAFNVTFNNINLVANVLSIDFYEIIKKHMNDGALILVNPTNGVDAYHTFATAFPYIQVFPRLYGTLIGSLQPFQFRDNQITMAKLDTLQVPEGKLLDLNNSIHQALISVVFKDMANPQNQDKSSILRRGGRLITDNDPANEYYLLRYLRHGPGSILFR